MDFGRNSASNVRNGESNTYGSKCFSCDIFAQFHTAECSFTPMCPFSLQPLLCDCPRPSVLAQWGAGPVFDLTASRGLPLRQRGRARPAPCSGRNQSQIRLSKLDRLV